VVDPARRDAALALRNDTTRSVSEICRILGVSRNTYYKYVRSADTATVSGAASDDAARAMMPPGR
jgi:transposase-like protein